MKSTFKSGFVAIVGRPNVGKSTLLNNLIGEKIAIVSEKPQTTRNKITGIINGDDYQFMLVDTPGMHKPKHKLGKFMISEIGRTLSNVDVVLFVVEATKNEPTNSDKYVIQNLNNNHAPVILIINKIDRVKKEEVLGVISNYKDLYDFNAVIPISAKTGDGLDRVIGEIKNIAPEGDRLFSEDEFTDQMERQLISEYIREKALILLSDEVPHGVGINIVEMKDIPGKNIIDIKADIVCEKESHKAIIIGRNGKMLKKIGELARADIENMFGNRVYLELWVKVRKDWRNSSAILYELGYKAEK